MKALAVLLLLCLPGLSSGSDSSAESLVKGKYRLSDARGGKTVTSADFKGKVQLVFFGFTHCRLTCPVGLARLGRTLEALGDARSQVVPLFITTDPRRDTPAVMKAYVANFPGGIIPLVGSPNALAAAMRSFRLEAQKTEAKSEDDYQMDHPAIFYVMDRNGRFAMTLPSNGEPEELAGRIRGILKAAP